MLQGVEILSQEVVNTVRCNYSILIIGIIVSMSLGVFFSCLAKSYCGQAILFLGIFISLIFTLTFFIPTGEYTQYKVTISDKVNFVEFNEKYEIISQDGEIYTIKEREEKE